MFLLKSAFQEIKQKRCPTCSQNNIFDTKSRSKSISKNELKNVSKLALKLCLLSSIWDSFFVHFTLKKRPWGTLGAPGCPQRGKIVPRRASRPPKSTKNDPQELQKHLFFRLFLGGEKQTAKTANTVRQQGRMVLRGRRHRALAR